MKPIEKLTDKEADQLALMFEIAPRLADAYRLKNEFFTVIRSKSSAVSKQKLADWLLAVEAMDLPEFHDCTKAYHNLNADFSAAVLCHAVCNVRTSADSCAKCCSV